MSRIKPGQRENRKMNSDKYKDNEKNKDRRNDTEKNRDKKRIKTCLKNEGEQRWRYDRILNKITIERKGDLRDNGVKDKFNDKDRATQTGIKGM